MEWLLKLNKESHEHALASKTMSISVEQCGENMGTSMQEPLRKIEETQLSPTKREGIRKKS